MRVDHKFDPWMDDHCCGKGADFTHRFCSICNGCNTPACDAYAEHADPPAAGDNELVADIIAVMFRSGGRTSADERAREVIAKVRASAAFVKHDGDKPTRPELVPYDAVDFLGRVLKHGAAKYGDHNWLKGTEWSRYLGAAERHLGAFKNGEDADPESGLPHLAHALCCIAFLLVYQLRAVGTDDRHKWEREVKWP